MMTWRAGDVDRLMSRSRSRRYWGKLQGGIRKEFVSVVIQTTSGRVLMGLPVERTDASITIADAKGDKQTIPASDIDEIYDSPISLMPENLYLLFQPQQLRELFAYIQLEK